MSARAAHDGLQRGRHAICIVAVEEGCMDQDICRHPACDCETRAGAEFCSEECRRASGDAAEHARCDCGHSECSENAATGEHAGESGRVGYLVLYMMGVPIGVLLLLWVLFGNNLIAPG
jgi:hypothetical protein